MHCSVFARIVVYPIDVVRTLQAVEGRQLQLSKLRLADYYRGLAPACVDAFVCECA
eukprot:SAG22_NODE_234_length_14360_cov_13.245915_14_plen_56_part_00